MNSKIVPFTVILVVVLIIGGGLIYSALQKEEEITVEIKGKDVSLSFEDDPLTISTASGRPLAIYDCYLLYTSSYGKDVVATSVPDLVIVKDGVSFQYPASTKKGTYIVPGYEPYTFEPGKWLSTKITYELNAMFDLSECTYHFALSDQMIKAGNYILVQS